MQEIEDLKPAEEIKERIDSPTEEQIHNERLNRELIQEESNENQSTETKEEVTDDRERTSSGDSSSKFFAEIVFTKKMLIFSFFTFYRFWIKSGKFRYLWNWQLLGKS